MPKEDREILRANYNHPLAIKFQKLIEFMDENKIQIEYLYGTGYQVTDIETKETYRIVDIEKSYGSQHSGFETVPPDTDYKLLREK